MIEKYYFLFGLAIVWIMFAVVQDLKKREVANWLNFSLIAFVLAYRAFYSALNDAWWFLGFGLLGFGVFFVLANALYYGKVFAGGDAKLFMGIGAILPVESYSDLIYEGIGFIFVLFIVGAIYSVIWSGYLAAKMRKEFDKEFLKNFKKTRGLFVLVIAFGIVGFFGGAWWFYIAALLFVLSLFYVYLFSVERCCMIKLIKPGKLMEGDWLDKDVKIGRRVVKRSVHGLSADDINLLRKARKEVLIKEGIPFTPAFLIAFLIMVYAWAVLGFRFLEFFSSFL